jgi:predicted ATPase
MSQITKLSIEGFQSIKSLKDLKLSELNILIGANGSGKSNFISYFRMLCELVERRLQLWVSQQGGADRIFTYGLKHTKTLSSEIYFGRNGYRFSLIPTVEGGVVFEHESVYFDGDYKSIWRPLGSGHTESQLDVRNITRSGPTNIEFYVYNAISSWRVYHFHDTSNSAGVKQSQSINDHRILRPDASNLASYLYYLKQTHPNVYNQIRRTIQLAIPFFDDFVLDPERLPSGEKLIRLLWRQKDSDYPFSPSQLSDGSLRFMCLTTALLQPNPPSTLLIDEPELGLHPYAITLLGSLIKSASTRMQVIVSTQSISLVNEFSAKNLIVAERENGYSIFKTLDEDELADWLEEYTLGQLWEKNIIGGRPNK